MDEKYLLKSTKLQEQSSALEDQYSQLVLRHEKTTSKLESLSLKQILLQKTNIVKSMQDLKYKDLEELPIPDTFLMCNLDEDKLCRVKEEIQALGKIEGNVICPEKTEAIGDGLVLAKCGETYYIKLEAYDSSGCLLGKGGHNVTASLKSTNHEGSCLEIPVTVTHLINGIYNLRYSIPLSPDQIGELELAIKVDGSHIKDSPWLIPVDQPFQFTDSQHLTLSKGNSVATCQYAAKTTAYIFPRVTSGLQMIQLQIMDLNSEISFGFMDSFDRRFSITYKWLSKDTRWECRDDINKDVFFSRDGFRRLDFQKYYKIALTADFCSERLVIDCDHWHDKQLVSKALQSLPTPITFFVEMGTATVRILDDFV